MLPDAGTPSRNQILVICGLLVLMVGLVFGQTVCYEFVNYDDDKYIFANSMVLHGLSARGTVWALTNRAIYWGPLTWISLMLDSQVYGQNAGGYHLTNVLLHAATAILLFLVLRRMTGRAWASALATMLFAVHPLRVESVAWVTERKDVLSGLFFTLTLAAYLGYVRHPFSLLRYLAVMIFFALGLLSKASLVPLPALLLLLDYWPLGRMSESRRATTTRAHGEGEELFAGTNGLQTIFRRFVFPWRLVIEKLPLLALVAGSCAATVWSQKEAIASIDRLSWWWRIGSAMVSYVAYLGQSFYPVGLAVVYPRSDTHLSAMKIIAAALVLLGITVAAFMSRRKCPCLLVGWLWYLGMLLPVIGLVQFGAQTMADRFTYLPQIGLCVAVAWSVADACRFSMRRRWVGGLISALALAVLMGAAWRQTSFWRDSESMWNHTLACTSGNALAHYDLGLFLVSRDRPDEAIAQYRKAVEVDPEHANAQNNMAIVFAGRGQFAEAIAHYREALKINPRSAEYHNNIAYALAHLGRWEEAVVHYRKCLELDPRCALAHYNYGVILASRGWFAEALAHYRIALKVQPDNAECRYYLAWLLATCPVASLRNGEEAVAQAVLANQRSDGKQPGVFDCLACAYAEAGRFPEAVATARRGLALAIEQGNRALASNLRARIALYEAGKPFHPMSAPAHGSKTK